MDCSDTLVKLGFCSQASRLKLLRCVVRDAAEMAGLDEQKISEVVLAVNEACMNVIQHAYRMKADGWIDLEIRMESGALVFRLRDYAARVDAEHCRSRALDDLRPGGLGIHLIRSVMDECGFVDLPQEASGNLFEMKKHTGNRS